MAGPAIPCACGCGRIVPPKRLAWALPRAHGGAITATDACHEKLKKRRQRGGLCTTTTTTCLVCGKPLRRGPKQQRKLYHDDCVGVPRKIVNLFLRGRTRAKDKRREQVNQRHGSRVSPA